MTPDKERRMRDLRTIIVANNTEAEAERLLTNMQAGRPATEDATYCRVCDHKLTPEDKE